MEIRLSSLPFVDTNGRWAIVGIVVKGSPFPWGQIESLNRQLYQKYKNVIYYASQAQRRARRPINNAKKDTYLSATIERDQDENQ